MINTSVKFAHWQKFITPALCSEKPKHFEGSDLADQKMSGMMLTNNTAMKQLFRNMNHKYDLMYGKHAFTHWYISEGLIDGDFTAARENLAALEADY